MIATQDALDRTSGLAKFNFEVVVEELGLLSIRLPLAGNTNHLGTMYAGALYSLAEFPVGSLYLQRADSTMVPTLGELCMRYHRPALTDVTTTQRLSEEQWEAIEAGTRANGKYRFQRTCEVLDSNGDLVASATGTYFSLLLTDLG